MLNIYISQIFHQYIRLYCISISKYLPTISRYIIIGVVFIYTSSHTYASQIEGITIYDRSSRGADESMRLYTNPIYKKFLPKNNSGSINTGSNEISGSQKESPAQIKKNIIQSALSGYARERDIDSTLKEIYRPGVGMTRLFWPIEYNNNKTKIVIHHTAGEFDNTTDTSETKEMKNIYRFHTASKGWGDVGYNYVIGPSGKIYEGRAGGLGAIGAHTYMNNTKSIGISIMGNYNTTEPSPEVLKSIVDLSTKLAKYYHISPYDSKNYFRSSNKYPYVQISNNYSIVGHTDAGLTDCPGRYLYDKIDYIRYAVDQNLKNTEDFAVLPSKYLLKINQETRLSFLPKDISTYSDSKTSINIKNISCNSIDNDIIARCNYDNGLINLYIKNNQNSFSGYKIINMSDGKNTIQIHIYLIGNNRDDLNKAKISYQDKYGKIKYPSSYAKVDYKLTLDEAKKLLNKNISIMLYELSTEYSKYDIYCNKGCKLEYQKSGLNQTISDIYKTNIYISSGSLYVSQSGKNFSIESATLIPVDRIQFTNYKRNSYSKSPRNMFEGKINISKDRIRKLDGKRYDQYIIINQLPLKNYMYGIAESHDGENPEKMKLMSLMAKQYAVYYMNRKNSHQYVSTGSKFTMTDDPRINQKYVGIGYSSKKRRPILEETFGQFVTYDGYITLIPYFSCSPGWVYGPERFGRSDTPYMSSKLDPYGLCDVPGNFQGHGVGISGKGANIMAQMGYTYRQIFDYYLDNIEIN